MADKKTYGLLGHKIKYSLSPAMHNAAFKKLGLGAEYVLFDCGEKEADNFLKALLRSHVSGLNVTVPYKMKAFEFVGKFGTLDKEAERIGAINTIVVKDASIFGYNTDAFGFIKSIKTDLKFDPRMKDIFICGAGGAGTACAMKVARVAEKVFIFDTDEAKARILGEKFIKYFGSEKLILVGKREKDIKDAISKCSLLVNATPYGRKKGEALFAPDYLHKGLSVYDLIYSPSETDLLKEAKKRRLQNSNGLGMLLYQGVKAFELWTGKRAPVNVMRKALNKEIEH